MSNPTFGISITRIDNEPRPAVYSDMSVVGLIGTAPEADPAMFPLDTPVFLYSDDAAKRTALGTSGTISDALTLINAQLGEFQVAAKVVVVRVEEGDTVSETIASIVGDGISTGLEAFVQAGPLLGVIPRLLCAPGFTSQRTGTDANAVCAALPALCNKLLAHAVVDGPATTEQAAIDWRETISSSRLIPVDPAVRVMAGSEVAVMPLSPAVTVGGVSCTYINTTYPSSNPNSGIRTSVYVSSAPVPGGATADVTVAFAGAATFCTVRAIALYGLKTPTPSANVVDLTGGDNSLTINVPQDGILLATTTRWQTAGPYTWSGVASVLDAPDRTVSAQNNYEDLAIEVPSVAATGRTIACADTTDDPTNHLMAIAWEGAGVPTGMIRFVGAAVTTSSGAMSLTSLTGGMGSAPQAGDLVIVAIAGNATSNIDVTLTTPSGYSELADLYSSDTYDTNLGVFWKFMGASPDTSVTIPGISVPAAVAYVLRNVDPGTPFDAAATTATGFDTAMGDPPSITTVTENAMVISVLGHSSNDGSATPPAGYSNVASVGNGSGNWEGAAIASKIKYAAGVENPAAWADIASSAGSSWAAVTIALRPKS